MRNARTLDRFNWALCCVAVAMAILIAPRTAWAVDLAQPVTFSIQPQPLVSALIDFSKQAQVQVMSPGIDLKDRQAPGVNGRYAIGAALDLLLVGSQLSYRVAGPNTIAVMAIVSDNTMTNPPSVVAQAESGAASDSIASPPALVAEADPAAAAAPAAEPPAAAAPAAQDDTHAQTDRFSRKLETVIVTAQRHTENLQNVPIAVTALSQAQLTSRQIAGGPDLVKSVPNLTFSKTNFTGYNIEIRGIGTQAISVTTDPAVAVAFNGIPFIRNHFFEQEFYDVGNVEVSRGPQGTLYGRNATAGVFNLVSAKASNRYDAMLSADGGNYVNRRLEAMLNVPLIGNQLDLRLAGEATARNGYTYDTTTGQYVDGRNLQSGRVTLSFHPIESLQGDLIYEHFNEDDNRLRSGKTLCTTDSGPSSVNGPDGLVTNIDVAGRAWLSQGCSPGSLYAKTAYGVPNPGAIPYIGFGEFLALTMPPAFNPYGTAPQSQDLRVIGSGLPATYQAKNDTVEFDVNENVTESVTLTSQTGYNSDFLYSTEDFNRFNTVPGAFLPLDESNGGKAGLDGIYCDPQLGCSNQFLAEDLSQERAQQFYQEFRLASKLQGPLNFSVGANYTHYQTLEDYYVFTNVLSELQERESSAGIANGTVHVPFNGIAANSCNPQESTANPYNTGNNFGLGCGYTDPHSLGQIDGQGHNYYRNENPYRLNSWATFGELYYNLQPDLKLTLGMRWTDDIKKFTEIPSWTLVQGKGYPVSGVLDQEWKKPTGRLNLSWTPKLDFTDQTLIYASYAHGYKGGGANPPGAVPILGNNGVFEGSPSSETHPLTFQPEEVDAFELGTKNTVLDGTMTFNANVFYYAYRNYQISEIVDRTAVNSNYNAKVFGAELETTWEPKPRLIANMALGYEYGAFMHGSQSIDLMDRTDGNPDWMVVKPFITQTSNCILPTSVVNQLLSKWRAYEGVNNSTSGGGDLTNPDNYLYFINHNDAFPLARACLNAYSFDEDPGHGFGGQQFATDFNPATAPNNGEGFYKNITGNRLPNMPPVTVSYGTQYSMPLSETWIGTLRGDFYWQANSFARIYNDDPYDRIHGYTNLNLSLMFDSIYKLQAMFYVKNVLNVTAITGAFLNSDDAALSTNVFLTDPRLFGVRITKRF